MYEKLSIKQNGKDISLCFMNNDSFKKESEGKDENEMLMLGEAIYKSALQVLSNSNKQYGILSRQIQKMDEDSVFYKVANRKREKVNNTIETINGALDALETGEDKEFHWIAYMISKCIGTDNANEEE